MQPPITGPLVLVDLSFASFVLPLISRLLLGSYALVRPSFWP